MSNDRLPGSFRTDLVTMVRDVLGRWPRRVGVIIGLGVVKTALEGLSIAMLVPLLSTLGVQQADDNQIAAFARRAFAEIGLSFTLLNVLIAVSAIAALTAAVSITLMVLTTLTGRQFYQRLQTETFARVIAPHRFYQTHQRLGETVTTLTKFAGQAFNGMELIFRSVIDVLLAIVLFAVALWQAPMFVGIVILAGALIGLPVLRHLRHISRLVTEAHNQFRRMNVFFAEHLKMSLLISALGAEKESLRLNAAEIERNARIGYRLKVRVNAMRLLTGPASIILLCGAVFVGYEAFGVGLDRLFVLVAVYTRLIPRLIALLDNAQRLPELLLAYRRVLRTQQDSIAAAPAKGGLIPDWRELATGIRFDELRVRAEDSEILKGASGFVPAKRLTALVGPSGSGKSTLALALMGLVPTHGGAVMIEGRDLATLNNREWRKKIGYVAQEPPMFHASIRDNVMFSGGDMDDGAIMAALEKAELTPFIQRQPDGLDTLMGEDGGRVSGGERQRIALARALVRHPILMILDEPTSALDSDTAATLIDTIRILSREVTILAISHDPRIADAADHVIYMNDGTCFADPDAGRGSAPAAATSP